MSRSSSVSEPEILSVGNVTLPIAREHQEALKDGGLSGDRIDQMERDIGELEDAPTYQANQIALRGRTVSKNEALDLCNGWGRKLQQAIVDRHGKDSPEAFLFPSKQLTAAAKSEEKMLMVIPTLLDLTEQLMAESEADGELEELWTEGTQVLDSLHNTELGQELFKVESGRQARHRQILRDRIYDAVNDINKTGRRVYRNDPEKRDLFRSKWSYTRSSSDDPESDAPEGDPPGDGNE